LQWVVDIKKQLAADANRATWYVVTDYTGSGRLMSVGTYHETVAYHIALRITIDGNATEWYSVAAWQEHFPYRVFDVYTLHIPLSLEFDTSLKVEIANNEGAAKNIYGTVMYGKVV